MNSTSYVPWLKILFYGFTILFHVYMLVRAVFEERYLIAAILLIPVTAVSLALYRYVKKTVKK